MAQMSGNGKSFSRDFGDSSQLTNWILYSRATCRMNPQVSDFIPGLLEDTEIYIEFADGYNITENEKGQV